MFDKIIAYSIKHKFIVGILVVALIIVGLYSLKTLPIDALPDITNNQVQILTSSPNLATQEVERFITYPIELAVKSIPEIVELRSVSKFGLSIVTVVFLEDTDIYWARNQITERLKAAEDEIPAGYGSPEMAPISTGLGEIYQYTLSAKPGFEDQFNTMDLRSIQDWDIVPKLLGTKGVAEVNTLGGVLKEYEVAVDPARLNSMGIKMTDIFEALQSNNENTGGAYIDKKPYAYFIRSIGMVNSLEDISKIVVKTQNNIPILIRDVAKVQYGNTVRYGATTKDGKGEVVNGMVMMLKGENSAEIVELVKERIEKIKTTLPEGVQLVPYLDRSKLVNRAIATVRTNLIEGALIVIFILVLLIGNWRAGLIVASVIPLSLLFAVCMMRLFNVSGNLMSLGAIDFGLIVDGAVIIVEAIVHRLHTSTSKTKLTSNEMDDEVYKATSSIRSSAAFGEIIILIVYLPILVLVGIEGKMFAPMAQTVSFAILGAFILSLTYVPMASALFLSKNLDYKENLSDKIIAFFQRLYEPVLKFSLRFKALVIIAAISLFAFSLYVFSTLGGEFIPTLSEGDIATHVMIPPGSSLSQEILSTTKAEQLLLDNFPEIIQIVSKIGSAEVPTDPMPMEVADVMIIMKDKSEWTSASSKEEMFEKMEKVLDDLPGVTTEFSQPIQMRFNELMTGIRSDVGIKIFGDDLDRLVSLGDEMVELIESVEGVEDARAETVSGFPQLTVRYNKDKIALYGLNISDINQAVSMGFAGSKAGVIYENERKYDLVIRLDEQHRNDISSIDNLYINLPSGNQIPLGQVADIAIERGPAQISRENGSRRITVGFNARNRDVESIVEEIQGIISEKLTLPLGYYLEYAGQFENLKRAKSRLGIAVPIALALIFILLYFTFQSVVQSIMIFTAIPLSAIGGIFALWLRDMPFSISAGIGFIALFGVAVLNGIVLISYFNQLKKEGMSDVIQRIKVGTKVRLRPVIMTGAVASLGFLPMALSQSAGAEVQKPLATVVIGGLLTAIILTLIILPILYYFSEKKQNTMNASTKNFILILLFASANISLQAQGPIIQSLDDAIEAALKNSPTMKTVDLESERMSFLADAAYVLPKAEIEANFGQMNTRTIDQSYSISQSFNPFVSKAAKAFGKQSSMMSANMEAQSKNEIRFLVRKLWNDYEYHEAKGKLVSEKKELVSEHAIFAERQYELGEINKIEKTTTSLAMRKITQDENLIALHKQTIGNQLLLLCDSEELSTDGFAIDEDKILLINFDQENSTLAYQAIQQEIKIAKASSQLVAAQRKPDFKLGYFIQSIEGNQEVNSQIIYYNQSPRFQGVKLGMSLPIFGKAYKTNEKISESNIKVFESKSEAIAFQTKQELEKLKLEIQGAQNEYEFYKNEALPLVKEIKIDLQKKYTNGEIGFSEYEHEMDIYFETMEAYLLSIKNYNNSIYDTMYLNNK